LEQYRAILESLIIRRRLQSSRQEDLWKNIHPGAMVTLPVCLRCGAALFDLQTCQGSFPFVISEALPLQYL
jgi:hypothetical protein